MSINDQNGMIFDRSRVIIAERALTMYIVGRRPEVLNNNEPATLQLPPTFPVHGRHSFHPPTQQFSVLGTNFSPLSSTEQLFVSSTVV